MSISTCSFHSLSYIYMSCTLRTSFRKSSQRQSCTKKIKQPDNQSHKRGYMGWFTGTGKGKPVVGQGETWERWTPIFFLGCRYLPPLSDAQKAREVRCSRERLYEMTSTHNIYVFANH